MWKIIIQELITQEYSVTRTHDCKPTFADFCINLFRGCGEEKGNTLLGGAHRLPHGALPEGGPGGAKPSPVSAHPVSC